MNRAFILLTWSALMLCCSGQTVAKDRVPTAEMRLILDHHQTGDSTLDVKGLGRDPNKAAPVENDIAEYEVYEVP